MRALVVPAEISGASRKYEVLGIDGEPIPHLYSAGELGGIGDKIVVRVAYADSTIQDVEVLEQNETPEFGGAALEGLPENASPLEPAR